jgi:pyrimidine-nucleoside phosphorylase
MNQPLATHIGNALEVKEVIATLKCENMGSRLLATSLKLGSNMLVLSDIAKDLDEGRTMMEKALAEGRGYEKFKEFIAAQGGDEGAIENTELLPAAKKVVQLKAKSSGRIAKMDTANIGRSAMLLGAGRETKADEIDLAVGLVMRCELWKDVREGDVLCEMHVNNERNEQAAKELFLKSVHIV